jgi:hypothetical protein
MTHELRALRITIVDSFPCSRKFPRDRVFRFRIFPPRREERQVRITIFFAAFASLREIYRIFDYRSATLGPSW